MSRGAGLRDPRADDARVSPREATAIAGHAACTHTERPMTTSAISTAGLTKHYPGVPALTDLDLDVPAGSVYGFLGPNGAGQVHHPQDPRRAHPANVGHRHRRGHPRSRPAPPTGARSATSPRSPRFYDWMTGRETLRVRRLASTRTVRGADDAWIDDGPRPGRPRRRRPTAGRRPTRAACASGSASPRRWSAKPERPPPRRAGQRARPDRPARGPRPHARAQGRDDGLLLDPHPRRRPARQRPRRDPRPRPPRPRRAHRRSCSQSFTNDRLRVALGGADDATGVELAELPGVRSVEPAERDGDAPHLPPAHRARGRRWPSSAT